MVLGMKKSPGRFCQPTLAEQTVLENLSVRLVTPEEVERFDQLIVQEHYLHTAQLVGEPLRYLATYQGEWLALAAWSAPARHLKARDQFIGWAEAQRRKRLASLANNSRLLVLPARHYPNLVSRFMKLMRARLSPDWQARWEHPVVLAETFVDPALYRGTAYRVSGWSQLGETSGWKRSAVAFYEPPAQPKQIWVRELIKKACGKLRAPQSPPAWAGGEAKVLPQCTAKVSEISSLLPRLRGTMPEFRRKQSLAYPLAGVLALMALARFSGAAKGYADLAE